VSTGQRKLTLTFDNGPDPVVTPAVLAELASRNLRAIFLPVGELLETREARALVRDCVQSGHRVGNHTYSHPRPFGAIGAERSIAEVRRTDELLGDLIEPERYFRPSAGGGVLKPGVLNQGVVDYLIETRHTLVMWNLICEDWCRPDGSWVDIALREITNRDWSVIVLHDIGSGAMDHLAGFLDRVGEKGVDLVRDLPADCTPILRGVKTASLDHLI
jgi:peptidoglycan/xylan/chitin deacetylase (PgdA/CDA1 family)